MTCATPAHQEAFRPASSGGGMGDYASKLANPKLKEDKQRKQRKQCDFETMLLEGAR